MHEQNIDPIQNIDTSPGNRGDSAQIGSEIGTLSHKKEGVERESARTFLISENETEYLVLNSNTEDLVDTRQADNNTEGVLDTSRDPPESCRHTRSGADSLKSQTSLQVTGQMLELTLSQPVAKGSQIVSLAAVILNLESMMLLCFSRSLSSMKMRRKNMMRRIRVSSSRRILMSWQMRKSASSMRIEKRKGDSREKEIPLHSLGPRR